MTESTEPHREREMGLVRERERRRGREPGTLGHRGIRDKVKGWRGREGQLEPDATLQGSQAGPRVRESPSHPHGHSHQPHLPGADFLEEAKACLAFEVGGLPSPHWWAPSSQSLFLPSPRVVV